MKTQTAGVQTVFGLYKTPQYIFLLHSISHYFSICMPFHERLLIRQHKVRKLNDLSTSKQAPFMDLPCKRLSFFPVKQSDLTLFEAYEQFFFSSASVYVRGRVTSR